MCQAPSGETRGSKDDAWSQDTPHYGQIPKAVSRALERPVAPGVWVQQEQQERSECVAHTTHPEHVGTLA